MRVEVSIVVLAGLVWTPEHVTPIAILKRDVRLSVHQVVPLSERLTWLLRVQVDGKEDPKVDVDAAKYGTGHPHLEVWEAIVFVIGP